MEHFLIRCEEFRWERQDLLEKIRQSGRNTRVDGRVEDEGKMAMFLGRNASLEREVRDRVDECIVEEVRSGGRSRRNWFTVEVPMNLVPYNPPNSTPSTCSQ